MKWLLILMIAMLAGCVDESETDGETNQEPDSDGDGVPDAVEVAAGSDPQNATSVPATAFEPVWGDESSPIRPGAPIGYCTYNFLFWAPNGTYYIGTAAHCTDGVGQRMPLEGMGEIGTVVYDSDETADSLVDFSLIQLDDGLNLQANPKVFGHEGPTGFVTAEELAVGDTIELHGYGVILGDNAATRDRFGFLVDWTDDEYNIDMPAVNGDSGSSLLHGPTGKAFGIISRYGIDNMPPSTDRGPLMPFIFRVLDNAGLGDVELATI